MLRDIGADLKIAPGESETFTSDIGDIIRELEEFNWRPEKFNRRPEKFI